MRGRGLKLLFVGAARGSIGPGLSPPVRGRGLKLPPEGDKIDAG